VARCQCELEDGERGVRLNIPEERFPLEELGEGPRHGAVVLDELLVVAGESKEPTKCTYNVLSSAPTKLGQLPSSKDPWPRRR
jgi:hypothetical protein